MNDAAGIFDASPLIALADINRLDLVPQLFETAFIPRAVLIEISRTVGQPSWLIVRSPAPPLDVRVLEAALGAGETEAIALTIQLGAAEVVLDDYPARRLALRLDLLVVGTVGLLLRAKRHGLIKQARAELLALRSSGFFLDSRLIEQALADVGETM
jgi:predicted nucleic acid-binding protein